MSRLLAISLGLAIALGGVSCAGSRSNQPEPDERVPDAHEPDEKEPTAGTSAGGADDAASQPPDAAQQNPPSRPQLPAPNIAGIFDSGCATESLKSELLPTNLLFVLDRSASMACNPPPTTDSQACEDDPVRADETLPSKWEIAREALFGAIRPLIGETRVGLSYFSNDDSCGVNQRPSVPLAALDTAHLSGIDASLRNVQPEGATPLVGATVLAYRYLHQSALAGLIRGNKFVVLITDGSQSEPCSDPSRCDDADECTSLLVDTEVPKAAAPGVGIKTFVIGAPGSENARRVLSQIAVNGGTAPPDCDVELGDCHFDMTREPNFEDALKKALASIAGRALTCDLPVPTPADGKVDLDLVNVIYSPSNGSQPVLVEQDPARACEGGADGWQYTEGGTRIRLCGTICDRVRLDRGARVDVVHGCPSRRPD